MYITREQYLQALKDTKNPMDDDSGFTGTIIANSLLIGIITALREENTIEFRYQVDTKEFEYVSYIISTEGGEWYTGSK